MTTTNKQLLKEGTEFAGYRIIGKLNSHHDGEREVYHAVNHKGTEVALVVFNLKLDRYATKNTQRKGEPTFIDEVHFCSNYDSDGIPQYENAGIDRYGSRKLAWMTQTYSEAESLTKLLERRGAMGADDVVAVAKRLSTIISSVQKATNGGGHYNLNPDDILMLSTEDNVDFRLIGFANMGSARYGDFKAESTPFSRLFQAPEICKGIVNSRSDIYSLGMVLLTMLMGFPNEEELATVLTDLEDGVSPSLEMLTPWQYRKLMMKLAQTKLSISLTLVLAKAIEVKSDDRFNSAEKFFKFFKKVCVTGCQNIPEWETTKRDCIAAMQIEDAIETVKGKSSVRINTATTTKQKIALPKQRKPKKEGLDDVAGMAELKSIFRRDFISIVKNPEVAMAYGIRPSNCTLLYGPQGCGKTFIAEKAAIESGLNYRIVNPSDLGSIYIHGAQQKIAETFAEAEKDGPMILIFDEFDALVPKRESELNDKQAGEVNEMLTQLNNCAERGIYVIATTNRPTLLDPAIMRKGRVDRTIYVSLPDFDARKELFRIELEKRPISDDVDCEALAKATDNYTCSDITFIVEETARKCFEETLNKNLAAPLPLSMEQLMATTKATRSSVSDAQRQEFADLRAKMEGKENGHRKKVGFLS